MQLLDNEIEHTTLGLPSSSHMRGHQLVLFMGRRHRGCSRRQAHESSCVGTLSCICPVHMKAGV